MKRSTERILTTHAGSLPAPPELDPKAGDYEAQLREHVRAIVRRQVETGLDIINDGELSKGHWLAYLDARLGGFESRPLTASDPPPVLFRGKDREDFPGFYEEATRQGTLFYSSGYQQISPSQAGIRAVCASPVRYVGQKYVQRDAGNLRAALDVLSAQPEEAFLAVAAVASIEPYRFFEAANARHEHEYHVWENVKLPPDSILIPGVVSHATNIVEHPELVSERIQRFVRIAGTENVIAGTDCGFGGRIHPELAWAKLRALAEGARLATVRQ